MKKLIKFFAAGLLLASLAACGSDPADPSDPSDPTPVDPTPAVQPVTINKDSIQKVVEDGNAGAYATYAGAQTISGLTVTLTDVMPKVNWELDTIQFKATSGKMVITGGSFTKVTVKTVSGFDYAGGVDINGQKGDDAAINAAKVDTGKSTNSGAIYEFTVEVTLAAAASEITISNTTLNSSNGKGAALYVSSVTLA